MQIIYADELKQQEAQAGETPKKNFNVIEPRIKPARTLTDEQLGAALEAAANQFPIFSQRKMKAKDLRQKVHSHNTVKFSGKEFFVVVMSDAFKFFYDPAAKRVGTSRDHALRAVPPRKKVFKSATA